MWSAFLIGILGSMHCVGMCGPIALALPIPKDKNRYVGILLYNLGRVFMYSFLGLLFGLFGHLFVLAGLQQFLSIVSGIVLLGMVWFIFSTKSKGSTMSFLSPIMFRLKELLSFYLKKYSFTSLFFVGILNGLLPCGLVYFAVVGAISTGAIFAGSYYMILFGLGTIPAMFMVALSKKFIKNEWRFKLTKAIPIALIVMAIVLILRGLNLGIPFVSPVISSTDPHKSTCCERK